MLSSIIELFTIASVVAIPQPVYAIEQTVEVKAPETMHQIIERVSTELEFDKDIVHAVIDTETGHTWDCTLVGQAGEEGCYQIIRKYHDVDPLNFEEATRYFINQYKEGREYLWTGCSCTSTARVLGAKLPRGNAIDLIPNIDIPVVGGVVVFDYGHVAYVEKVTPEGIYVREGNYEKCRITRRLLEWNRTDVKGYYYEEPATSG